jgi:uncharacterized caspase-like protein
VPNGGPLLRDFDGGQSPPIPPVGDRWAVIVGISNYRAKGLNLQYAHRDAQQLNRLLRTPEGGLFKPEHIRLLVNKAATTGAVTRALRGFLMEARPEDLVLLYFACHGGPDPRRPGTALYLYTYDTDPLDIAGTALPMDDIDRALRDVVRAERTVIVVDACQSGGVGLGARAPGHAERTNRYLEALAQARGGVALLTSAEASESSEEDARWGGGHGVFTHYVLEGMRGAADGYRGVRDGIVSVRELFEYVRDQVLNATDGRQHPAIGSTTYDPGLPMAVTAELDVDEHLTLARGLFEVGWALEDPTPFLLAARELAAAADLKRHLPQADAERGYALLAAGRAADAAHILADATSKAPDEVEATAWLYLGIAEAETGQSELAVEAFREYVRRAPENAETGWATAYAEWLEGNSSSRLLHALIVGIGEFAPPAALPPLPGVANDVQLMTSTLSGTLVAAQDIRVLTDASAKRASVLRALAKLRKAVAADDAVLVYFTGHAVDTAGPDDPYLVTWEGRSSDGATGISPRELIDALDLPAREVLLILDTHVTPALLQLARRPVSGRLTVLLACGVGEVAYEVMIGGKLHGILTTALARALADGTAGSYGELLDLARTAAAALELPQPQTPQLIGWRSASLLVGRFPAADLWRTARRRTARADEIEGLRRRCDELSMLLVQWALGIALLQQDDSDGGGRELQRAAEALYGRSPGIWIDIAIAALDRGDKAAARDALEQPVDDAIHRNAAAGAKREALKVLASGRKPDPAVLVVGADPSGVALGAGAAVEGVSALLAETLGVAPNDIVGIAEQAGTRSRVLDELTRLASRAEERLVVFVLMGAAAFSSAAGQVVILMSDGELSVAEMAEALVGTDNIVILIDVVATLTSGTQRDLAPAVSVDVESTTAYALAGAPTIWLFEADKVQSSPAAIQLTAGPLRSMLMALPEALHVGRSYQEWADSVPLAPSIGRQLGGRWLDGPVMQDRSAMIAARRLLAAARISGAIETSRSAEVQIARREAQHEEHPEGHLQRALALEVCGRPQEALAALRIARHQYEQIQALPPERRGDAAFEELLRQARYHYGRLLFQHGEDFNEAVASLEAALRQDQSDPRVLHMLAQAIRALVERESLVQAKSYLVRYLNSGAPDGISAELVNFLTGR